MAVCPSHAIFIFFFSSCTLHLFLFVARARARTVFLAVASEHLHRTILRGSTNKGRAW